MDLNFLAEHSTYYQSLLGSDAEELATKTLPMKQFSSHIVSTALKLCQDKDLLSSVSSDDVLELYRFIEHYSFNGFEVCDFFNLFKKTFFLGVLQIL